MNDSQKIYKVLECKGVSGLTVGSKSRKPGSAFSRSEWPYGEDALIAAIAKKRCKLVSVKKDVSKDNKAIEKITKLEAALEKLGPDHKDVAKIKEKIAELQEELNS